MNLRLSLGLAALVAVLVAPAVAETPMPLELTGYVQLEKVTTDTSGERRVVRVDPDLVLPGDKLILGTRFTNTGVEPIERFVVTNPVPAAVTVSGEADPALLVSVDGGNTWGTLAQLAIVNAAGLRRPALPGDITHVRWILSEIAPDESGQVEFPVTVR